MSCSVHVRADAVATLEEAGLEVLGQAKSYVTVRDLKSENRWWLTGALYEHGIDAERLGLTARSPAGGRVTRDGTDLRARAEAAWQEPE